MLYLIWLYNFIFRNLATLVLQSTNWQLYRKAWLTFLRLYVLGTFWHTSTICVVYSNVTDSSRPKNGIKSWTLSCDYFFATFNVDYLNNTALMNLIKFLAMKLLQGPVFIDGMLHSTEVVVYSKTNFVKVDQNQWFFRKPLMLCPNWYCKIVMWPIVSLKQS